MTDQLDIAAVRAKAKMWHLPAGIADDILALCDAVDAERRARAVMQANVRETWQALCTMRNHLNEHLPMPSLESDLLQGPENSVFCAAVAEAVVNALAALRAESERLRIKVERMSDHTAEASNQARYRRAEIKGHQRRIVRLQAENERLRAELARFREERAYVVGWNDGFDHAALAQNGGEA